jgi:putative FmdB family regulatory protein
VPTYQYACTECGHAFEQFQSFSDDALTECPECQGRLRKVFNAVGVVFKGSGFYRNDSRPQKAGAESGASVEAGASKGSKGSESGKGNGSDSGSGSGKKSADTSSGSSSPSAPAPA